MILASELISYTQGHSIIDAIPFMEYEKVFILNLLNWKFIKLSFLFEVWRRSSE